MPTKRERDYYSQGYRDGQRDAQAQESRRQDIRFERDPGDPRAEEYERLHGYSARKPHKRKRKLSAWNKYVKANSKKPRFRYRNGKLNLKKMAVAFRKTPAGKKKRR